MTSGAPAAAPPIGALKAATHAERQSDNRRRPISRKPNMFRSLTRRYQLCFLARYVSPPPRPDNPVNARPVNARPVNARRGLARRVKARRGLAFPLTRTGRARDDAAAIGSPRLVMLIMPPRIARRLGLRRGCRRGGPDTLRGGQKSLRRCWPRRRRHSASWMEAAPGRGTTRNKARRRRRARAEPAVERGRWRAPEPLGTRRSTDKSLRSGRAADKSTRPRHEALRPAVRRNEPFGPAKSLGAPVAAAILAKAAPAGIALL